MHRLALDGLVTNESFSLVVQSLSVLSGSLPIKTLEHIAVFVPAKPPPHRVGSNLNSYQQYRISVSAIIKQDNDENDKNNNNNNNIQPEWFFEALSSKDRADYTWTLSISELPEISGTKNPAAQISQEIHASTICGGLVQGIGNSDNNDKILEDGLYGDDPLICLGALGYRFDFEYRKEILTFVNGSVTLRLIRLHAPSNLPSPTTTTTTSSSSSSSSSSTTHQLNHQQIPVWQLLDPTGTWILDAETLVSSATDRNAVANASSILKHTAQQLQGAVDLIVPERMAFDTRVHSQ